jgi:hypothetical protein
MIRIVPIDRMFGSTFGLAPISASTVMPNFAAIDPKVSPARTV